MLQTKKGTLQVLLNLSAAKRSKSSEGGVYSLGQHSGQDKLSCPSYPQRTLQTDPNIFPLKEKLNLESK